ncbi:hypothetical protein [Aliarcobacter thereius]|uniref:Uncharacterized protein n=1 Tax=Aliarcobacter thereius LMG 24486 TaxID=1032240 RepID=A0A1C7WS40_9BACT|nr:hypothetical protein [Aliarcobacter thereius]OCL95675.1 hypothetical protein AA347_01153 [Aliarcobacter thereius LMG 24486]QBF16340.1 hypothetical protein ATH_1294 [Aliarcobacter thereius LMG 24486]TLS91602.1 hypothetical protein FE244_08795 [Aliarcobacter thereius]
MQDEKYYINLIKEHYSNDYNFLKKKYKKSFKEIYSILENQEKTILKLQNIVLEYQDTNKEDILISIFGKNKNLYKSFITNLFKVDTSKPVNIVLYNSAVEFLNKIENNQHSVI